MMILGRSRNGRGFTLVELAIVLGILALVALMATSRLGAVLVRAKSAAAEKDLLTLKNAICEDYVPDMRGIPGFSLANIRLGNLLIATNVYVRMEGFGASRTPWVRVDDEWVKGRGCAAAGTFFSWDGAAERGWRGPYIKVGIGFWPRREQFRYAGDLTFEERGFYPEVSHLSLPRDILNGRDGCSVYGFFPEPAVMDPWGNPYVLQVPPPQAFKGDSTNVTEEARWKYARVVSAGADGVLSTPCFDANGTNWWATSWGARKRRLVRQAGMIDGTNCVARGDDLVLFLNRNDIDEGEADL